MVNYFPQNSNHNVEPQTSNEICSHLRNCHSWSKMARTLVEEQGGRSSKLLEGGSGVSTHVEGTGGLHFTFIEFHKTYL